MPNYRTHLATGTVAGGIAAGLLATHASPPFAVAEVAGGLLGGAIGGVMPDVLEPATSPNHRKLAHSLVAAGSLALADIAQWQAACRRRAASHTITAASLPLGCRERSDAEFAAAWWSFLAGLVAGFFVGYASHLAMDALTAKSLPVLGLRP